MVLSLAEIARMTGGRLVGDADATVTGFCTDSRQAAPGKMFVPIRGENVDGHKFIAQVFASGAEASFSETDISEPDGSVVYVENSRAALQAVAKGWRERFSIPVIGITGSVGKTTTKEMVALAVAAGLKTMKTAGNANSQIGLPMTVLRISEDDEAAVVEMGVSMPGEMERIANTSRPTVAVVTNIGVSHIEFMKTRENIMAEKLKIAEYLPENGKIFVNGDDDLLSTLDVVYGHHVVSFGFGEGCDWHAVNVSADSLGTSFICRHDGMDTSVYVPAVGEHMVRNALAALAVADAVGVPVDAAAKAIAGYKPPEMRQRISEVNGITLIDDTYNASPDSMRAALGILGGLKVKGKKFAVLADMLELGDYAVKGHRETGEFAAKCGTDELICVGELARHIAEGFASPSHCHCFESNSEAITWLKAHIVSGDVLLCKGSRGMHMDEVIDAFSAEKQNK